MTALERIAVGVIVERIKAGSPWADDHWQPAAVLPGQPDMPLWALLSDETERKTFYAGPAEIELFRTETGNYRDNLAADSSLWVVLRASGGEPPYRVFAVTADPAEGEAFTEAGNDIVDTVPMPALVRERVAAFIATHHEEQTFSKRERKRADPQALARRSSVLDDE